MADTIVVPASPEVRVVSHEVPRGFRSAVGELCCVAGCRRYPGGVFLITATYYLYLFLAIVVAVVSVSAFGYCAISNGAAFVAYGKRTKWFWLAVTGVSMLIAVGGLASAYWGQSALNLFSMIAAIASGVFLADVKPLVTGRR